MKAFAVKALIHATPEIIWALLTDASGYKLWNNTVDNVQGKIAKGERVTVHAKINPNRSIPNLQPAFDEFARDLKRAAEVK